MTDLEKLRLIREAHKILDRIDAALKKQWFAEERQPVQKAA
jgi:hypothetical protein